MTLRKRRSHASRVDEKLCRQAAGGGFGARLIDRGFDKIDAGHLMTARGKEQRGVTGAAPGIEQWALDPIGNRNEGPLRLADLPWGDAGIGLAESFMRRWFIGHEHPHH